MYPSRRIEGKGPGKVGMKMKNRKKRNRKDILRMKKDF